MDSLPGIQNESHNFERTATRAVLGVLATIVLAGGGYMMSTIQSRYTENSERMNKMESQLNAKTDGIAMLLNAKSESVARLEVKVDAQQTQLTRIETDQRAGFQVITQKLDDMKKR